MNYDIEIIELLKQMIAIPSYVDENTNEKELAFFIKNFFEKHNVEVKLDNVCEDRYNIIASVGENDDNIILLNGHIDTVPLYGNESLIEPVETNGNIYGRGANDMKGAIAAMMMALIKLKNDNVKLNGKVIFCGVIDEELGSLGTIDLIDKKYKFDAAIVGEPTSLRVCTGHRGLEWVTFKSYGKRIHSGSRVGNINAVENMIDLVNLIKTELPVEEHWLLRYSTFNIGTIQGGTQPSTVADYCEMNVDFRYLPTQSFEGIKDFLDKKIEQLHDTNPDSSIEYFIYEGSEMKKGYYHDACYTPEDDNLVKTIKSVLDNYNYDSTISSFEAWSDGGLLFSKLKIPTVVLGPGNLKTAHSDDEFIEIKQLQDAIKIYYDICLNYLNK